MEFIGQYMIEFMLGLLTLTLASLGGFQVRHNARSEKIDDEYRRLLDEQRNLMNDRHLSVMERMEKNQNDFQLAHVKTLESMGNITTQLTHTNSELNATNVRLGELTETVTFMIREEIPKIKDEINTIKLTQAHCSVVKEKL